MKKTLRKPSNGGSPLTGSEFRDMRRKKATTPGSEWVFFRDGDDHLRDPWAALAIRIVSVGRNRRGRMLLKAECTQPHMIKKTARYVPALRQVKYSELW